MNMNLKDILEKKTSIMVPGSYNPLHEGHLAIASYLISQGLHPVFEISKFNCSKPPISDEELSRRATAIEKYGLDCLITNYPYIYQKILYYPMFNKICLGVDTWNRFIDPNNYPSLELRDFCVSKCKLFADFWIMPRFGYTMINQCIDEHVIYCSDFVPLNISSTEIRNASTDSKI